MIVNNFIKCILRNNKLYTHRCNVYLPHAKKIYLRTYTTAADHDTLTIGDLDLSNYVKKIRNEYKELSTNTQANNHNRMQELLAVITILNKRDSLIDNINNLSELLQDSDSSIKSLAQEEKALYESGIRIIENELLDVLIPVDEDDNCNSIVLEVNAGVGGQEAMLFAHELFDMYCSFAQYKGWEVEVAEINSTDLGGIRHASALIEGHSVMRYFKFEAGVHRVQRIPATEKSGRVHTSTVSVLALPQPNEIEVNIQNKDLRIDTKRASGAGGQHVNTTDSAVRIVHLPTGISVECQVGRSQLKNKEIAMQKLRALLYQKQLNEQTEKTQVARYSQVRSNHRNEKIRTYNFSQDRITDHRLQSSNLHNIKVFLEGREPLEHLIEKLENNYKLNQLQNILENSVK